VAKEEDDGLIVTTNTTESWHLLYAHLLWTKMGTLYVCVPSEAM